MSRLRFAVAAVAGLWLVAASAVAQEAPLTTAHGVGVKAAKDSLTVRPRGAGGRFEKEVTLMVTGTSKISTLSMEIRADRPVPVQREADAKDLKAQQQIAVIYTQGSGGPVLLAAVVLH